MFVWDGVFIAENIYCLHAGYNKPNEHNENTEPLFSSVPFDIYSSLFMLYEIGHGRNFKKDGKMYECVIWFLEM